MAKSSPARPSTSAPAACASISRARLSKGENLVLYIDSIGRVEGVVVRVLNDIGYAVAFNVPPRKRDKIADQLTWLINKDRLGLIDEREAERRPGGGQVIAIYGKGVSRLLAQSPMSRSSASPSRPPAPAP
jgi:hypothetical protein